MRALFATILLLCSALAQSQTLQAGSTSFGAVSGPEFLPVEEAYQLEVEVIDDRHLRLYWQITDTYYLYQHAFKFGLEDSLGALGAEAEFPQALERSDEYFGDVRVFYTSADVTLALERPIQGEAQLQVSSQGCADAGLCYPPRTQHFSLDSTSGAVAETTAQPRRPAPAQQLTAPAGSRSLLYMLLMAFVGGAILNLMPCVFPILSLKVLSFAQNTGHDRHLHSWVYTAGVVVSFVGVAAVLIALQQAGKAVGWGFQLQSPGFVIALAYLFLVMGLSLSGLVELGSSLMGTGSKLADRKGLEGSFFTGVLAVIVASPCTAPFMGSALGFAMTQPPTTGLAVFAALGMGMAAPLLLFSYSGGARALMPRPGPWMETMKQLLAFPLYGTAIWLLWVAGRQTGVNTMTAVLSGGLALSMALWLWRFGGWRRALAVLCALLAVSLGSWRGLDERPVNGSSVGDGKVAWSEQKLAELRTGGTPVFVDVTADWCITCIANEQAVLFTDEMTAAFEQHGVAYMVADWTNYDPAIARFIESHGRTGIPLYLMYPAGNTAAPLMLPQILTTSTVKEALKAVSSP